LEEECGGKRDENSLDFLAGGEGLDAQGTLLPELTEEGELGKKRGEFHVGALGRETAYVLRVTGEEGGGKGELIGVVRGR